MEVSYKGGIQKIDIKAALFKENFMVDDAADSDDSDSDQIDLFDNPDRIKQAVSTLEVKSTQKVLKSLRILSDRPPPSFLQWLNSNKITECLSSALLLEMDPRLASSILSTVSRILRNCPECYQFFSKIDLFKTLIKFTSPFCYATASALISLYWLTICDQTLVPMLASSVPPSFLLTFLIDSDPSAHHNPYLAYTAVTRILTILTIDPIEDEEQQSATLIANLALSTPEGENCAVMALQMLINLLQSNSLSVASFAEAELTEHVVELTKAKQTQCYPLCIRIFDLLLFSRFFPADAVLQLCNNIHTSAEAAELLLKGIEKGDEIVINAVSNKEGIDIIENGIHNGSFEGRQMCGNCLAKLVVAQTDEQIIEIGFKECFSSLILVLSTDADNKLIANSLLKVIDIAERRGFLADICEYIDNLRDILKSEIIKTEESLILLQKIDEIQ